MKRPNILDAVLLAAFGLMTFAVLQPDGVLGRRFEEWRNDRRMRSVLEREWERLVRMSARSDPNASGTFIVEVIDYECPYCRRMHERMVRLLAEEDVHVGYLDFPLSTHPHAEIAARVAICAERRGRFRRMHEYLMTEGDWMNGISWDEVADEVGVPSAEDFSTCLYDDSTGQRLEDHRQMVEMLEVGSTPAFITEQRVTTGAMTLDELKRMVSR